MLVTIIESYNLVSVGDVLRLIYERNVVCLGFFILLFCFMFFNMFRIFGYLICINFVKIISSNYLCFLLFFCEVFM